jgi:hypothetical protein
MDNILQMKTSDLLIVVMSVIFIAVFSISLFSESEISHIIIFLAGIIIFLLIVFFKLITLGQLSVENGKNIKRIGKNLYYLNIDSKINIKYGIFLIKIYNDTCAFYLEKNEIAYKIMTQIHDVIKQAIDVMDDLEEMSSYEYKTNNKFLFVSYLFLILLGFFMYIYISKEFFFIVPSLIMGLILIVLLFCNKKIIISGDKIIISSFKEKNVYDIRLIKNIRTEVSRHDFKFYLRFFLKKNMAISTIGSKADFRAFKKIFDIYDKVSKVCSR